MICGWSAGFLKLAELIQAGGLSSNQFVLQVVRVAGLQSPTDVL